MKWLKRFLFITKDYCWKTKLWIISYAYLPGWLFDLIWKDRNE